MPRIQFVTSYACETPEGISGYKQGKQYDVDQKTADEMTSHGIAVAVTEETEGITSEAGSKPAKKSKKHELPMDAINAAK